MSKPKIRFKGFIEDWEQRKLSDCAGFRRGSFPQPYGNKDWYDGEGEKKIITLHQRKYEELQKIKKFMLQNMFI